MAALGLVFALAAVSTALPPTFAPWFESRCPDLRLGSALAVIDLAAEGAVVPFIARYRKEKTGNLDEVAVRRILEARELWDRIIARQAIIVESIGRHATLTPELRDRILSSYDLDELEDLYLPYKQKKKSRALLAQEAGLQPLADWIWGCGHGTETAQEGQTLELWAFTFRNPEKGIADAKAAIEGARDILAERLAETCELRKLVRRAYLDGAWLKATRTEKAKPHSKFEAYFAFQEKVASLREPANSHRFLAVRRGQAEGELNVTLVGPPDDPEFDARLIGAYEAAALRLPDSPGAEVLRQAARIAFKGQVRPEIESEVYRSLKEAADAAATQGFAENLRRVLLEAPFGPRPVLGVDPGTRAGSRLAVVDGAGAFVTSEVLHLQSDEEKARAREAAVALARQHGIAAVAVGNGAAGREAEVFLRRALREAGLEVPVVLVSEAAASAYAPSDVGRAEFPALDAPVRGAISIARRLQDPLAELVKLEPRGIAVGQYQHDVAPAALQHALDAVVESCVNRVGVNLNAASVPLLARVAGIGPALAQAIVEHRSSRGPFRSRRQLLEVPHLGPRAFEQAAGFLRVPGGEHPLDNTGVHPERYPALEGLAERLGCGVADLLGSGSQKVREAGALKDELGAWTFEDIVAEIQNPGGDPRAAFVPFTFRDDVLTLEHLKPGMLCPGIVSNVASFGAFVDIGVQHDGLIHVSQLGAQTLKDAKEVVKTGDRVSVRVLKVDLEKRQISLTMRPARHERKPAPARRPARPPRPPLAVRADAVVVAAPRPPAPPPVEGPPGEAAKAARPRPSGERSRPERSRPDRPAPPPDRRGDAKPKVERRPERVRQAFNNPFAVLASLKVPSKRNKS